MFRLWVNRKWNFHDSILSRADVSRWFDYQRFDRYNTSPTHICICTCKYTVKRTVIFCQRLIFTIKIRNLMSLLSLNSMTYYKRSKYIYWLFKFIIIIRSSRLNSTELLHVVFWSLLRQCLSELTYFSWNQLRFLICLDANPIFFDF